ncbi:hypothetical protein [Weissella tructae]
MANISLFMTNFKNQTYEFPIAPESFEFKRDAGNEKISITSLGEINRLAKKANLGTVDMTFSVPIDLSRQRRYYSGKKLNWRGKTGGKNYMGLLEAMFTRHEVVRVVLTDTRFNFQVTFDDFTYSMSGSGDEYIVNITMTEWRDYAPKVLKKGPIPKKVVPVKQRPSKKVGVGSTVIVNGRLHYDSHGARPGQTEVNARRKINFVNPGAKYPYHVTLLDNRWRGWVSKSAVRSV